MAQQLGADPHFLYLPALPESVEEKRLLCSTEVYRKISQQWETLDTALVNIGDYPSSPDFASLVRYGSRLQEHRACGRMLVYYFNEEGAVIQSDQDFAIQIPIETLRRCPNIIGVCSANTSSGSHSAGTIAPRYPSPGAVRARAFLYIFHNFQPAICLISGILQSELTYVIPCDTIFNKCNNIVKGALTYDKR